ncbi:MAG: hypothetical protein Q9159_003908 [Coniocarpon cinnabarinum]
MKELVMPNSSTIDENVPKRLEIQNAAQSDTSLMLLPAESTCFMLKRDSESNIQSVANGEATMTPTIASVNTPKLFAGNGGNTTNGTCGAGYGETSGPCSQAPMRRAPGPSPAPQATSPGRFDIVGMSGVPAQHAALMQNDRMVFLDKVENYTQLQLPDGRHAYSAEYDPFTNQTMPLSYKTNAFCSGGAFLANGTLLDVGGNAPLSYVDPTVGDGFNGIRYLSRSPVDAALNGHDWSEPGNKLSSARWYPSVQTLNDGSVFVASGSLTGLDPTNASNNNPTYEMLNSDGISNGIAVSMDLLVKAQPYYMYPFIHLLRDGSLFIFVSKTAEIFEPTSNKTVRQLPELSGQYRTYPNTGGSVMLPMSRATNWTSDIVICGGGAYQDITSPTDASCGRIAPLGDDPKWEMDSMPEGRVMVEGTLLPDGTVVWMNGCSMGAQGYGLGKYATTQALIYDGNSPLGHRWTADANSTIPRMYHSVALLNSDATITVAGSNPNQEPVLLSSAQNPYITEFRVETYTPPYLIGVRRLQRPSNVTLSSTSLAPNGSSFAISFLDNLNGTSASVVLYHGGFVTHSLHMGARMAMLDSKGFQSGVQAQQLNVTMPPSANVAVPGPYMIFVLVDGTPSVGTWVTVVPPASVRFTLQNTAPPGDTANSTIVAAAPSNNNGWHAKDLFGAPSLWWMWLVKIKIIQEQWIGL